MPLLLLPEEHGAEEARLPLPDELRQDPAADDAARRQRLRHGLRPPQPAGQGARHPHHGMHQEGAPFSKSAFCQHVGTIDSSSFYSILLFDG